jgi:hypothetical protein
MIGMRWILWGDGKPLPKRVVRELERIIACILETDSE